MINVHGTREMLLLAKDCKRLRSFVHISTAYTHATEDRVYDSVLEQFYDSPMEPDALIQMVQGKDEKTVDDITPQIIKGWPNTYAFTKALAEELVRTMAGDLPICIVRPAIVICAYREPLPGWIDRSAVFGATGLIVGSGLGVLHVIYSDYNAKMDFVPVDVVNNTVIAAAHDTTQRRLRGHRDVRIYTVCSNRNPISPGTITKLIMEEGRKFSSMLCVWYGYGIPVKNRFLYHVLCILIHYIPGFIVDAGLLLCGKRPILTGMYNKVHKLGDAIGYYASREWKFGDSNRREMYEGLSSADRTIFNCSIDDLDWTLYIVLWCIGCRKYILRDGLKDTIKANRRQAMFRILNYLFVIGYSYLIYKAIALVYRAIEYLL